MSLRYNVDDLMKLRASPLICRPAHLPPIEEWMGNQDTASKRPTTSKGRQDDSTLPSETLTKRPHLLDAARKSSAAPEDIVLGPPRRSFASANSRIAAKGASPEGAEEISTQKDRTSWQERFKNGEDLSEKDHDRMNGKRMGRYEKDDTKPRRRNEEDEGEGRFRRIGERPKWDRTGREDSDVKDEEEGGRTSFRRDRAKFEQPWIRGARLGEPTDERRDDRRPQDWRGARGGAREWDGANRVEADPEWMDAGDAEEASQAHTQAEFQRWKESMKAGGTPAEGPSEVVAEQTQFEDEEKKISKTRITGPSEQDDAMDKFFAKFNDQKHEDVKKEAPAKAPVKTRFANIFSPPPETRQTLPTPSTSTRPEQNETAPPFLAQSAPLADADQEGFQRILQMLQIRSNNSTPQNQRGQNPRSSLYRNEEATRAQQRPDIDTSRVQSQEDTSRRDIGSERLMDTRSPPVPTHLRQESGNNSERQLLLHLLGQADTRAEQQRAQNRASEQRQGPGAQPSYASINQPTSNYNQYTTGANGRQVNPHERREPDSFFDEPAMFNTREPELQLRRRPTNEQALPAFFDEPYMSTLGNMRQNGQPLPKNMSTNSAQSQGIPPGLQRPPGLDQMPQLGWPSQQRQGIPIRQAPPPGIPNLPQRGMPAQFGASSNPNMTMAPPQQQQQQQPAPPRRKYAGEPGPAFPPGMGPPPGFMGAGPPPGFAQNYARHQDPGMQREFLEARFAADPRAVLRGGAGGMGPLPGAYR